MSTWTRQKRPKTHHPRSPRPAPPTRPFQRIGGACAAIGGTIALTGNLLHGPVGVSPEGLAQLAHNGHFGIYTADHFGLVLAVLLALGGLAAIAESFPHEPGSSWARFGMLAALAGTAVMLVALGIDGFAIVAIARAWLHAGPAEQQMIFHTAQALWSTFIGIFAVGVFVYFGCAPVLYGAAFFTSDVFPRWLGYAAVAGGLLGMGLGVTLAFVSISFTTYAVFFGASSGLLSLWLIAAGLRLWRDDGRRL